MQLSNSFYPAPGSLFVNQQFLKKQELQDLILKERYWINRIEIAQEDSISLTIDLQESLVTLDLKGIELRRCPVYAYRLSPLLVAWKQEGKLAPLAGLILTLNQECATIPKVPVIVREIEVGKPVLEDLSFLNRAFDSTEVVLDLTFDEALHIRFQQPEICWDDYQGYDLPFKKHYLLFFDDWIEVQLAAYDLRAIYRALPQKAKLILCL